MYKIVPSKVFERSLKKYKRSGIFDEQKLEHVIEILAAGKKLPTCYKDHKLVGKLKDIRECHVLPDLLLLYKIEKRELILILINLGSHSDIFSL